MAFAWGSATSGGGALPVPGHIRTHFSSPRAHGRHASLCSAFSAAVRAHPRRSIISGGPSWTSYSFSSLRGSMRPRTGSLGRSSVSEARRERRVHHERGCWSLLNRIDSHRKPAMIAAVFTAFAKQEIDTATLNRLLATIESLPSFEVETVRRFNNASPEERSDIALESLQALVNAGLATTQSTYGGLVYQPNQTCNTFVNLNIDKKPD